MNNEQENNQQAAKVAKRERQTDQTAQALRNVANVAKLAPETVGTVAKVAKTADDITGGRLSRGAAKAINHVPGAKIAGAALGNKAVSSVTNIASKSASPSGVAGKSNNPSKDGFSKGTDEQGRKSKSPGHSIIPTDDSTSSKKSNLFSSESLSVLFGDESSTIKTVLMIFLIIIVFFVVFIVSVISSFESKDTLHKAMAVAEMSSELNNSSTSSSSSSSTTNSVTPNGGMAAGLGVMPTISTISDIISKKIDFKIFNRNKPSVDGEGIASDYDGSFFGDFLEKMSNKYPESFIRTFYNLGIIFNTGIVSCKSDNCSSSVEFKFYQKISDISYRYKKLYNIELDWPLITATILINSSDKTETFKNNLNSYTIRELNDLKHTMSLDWDYVYDDIPGYDYLSGVDSRYDLQILAKNMVTKKTTQRCYLGDNITKETEIIDIEDSLIEKEKDLYKANLAQNKKTELEYYLPCKTNEVYEIESVYSLDKDKYDDFLDEYIETKKYIKLKPTENSDNGGGGNGPAPANGDWGWPLPQGASTCRSSCFGPRIHPITHTRQYHSGDDYPAAAGTPVYAIADGTVVGVTTGCVAGNMSCGGKAGNHVVIDHGNGITSVYMHASKVVVSNGQHVSRGDKIMEVGTTGSSTGNHLHITVKVNGTAVSPSDYIGALPACPNSCLGV